MNPTKSCFVGEFPITSVDADNTYMCRPSAIFSFLQMAITEHSQRIETSRDNMLRKYGGYWVVLRIWVRMDRALQWGETLTVKVTVRKPEGKRVYRDCDLFVGDEPVGEATTLWALIDQNTKKSLSLEGMAELPDENAPSAKYITLSRIVFPAKMELHDQRMLYYSDTDINGHIGNIRYVDLACDAAELDRRPQGVFVQELFMSYVAECYAGEQLRIYRGKENGQLYLHGVGPDNTDRFDCVIRMNSAQGL